MGYTALSGRTAVVTGGGTRVGAAIARALAGAGADLVVHYASSEQGARDVVDHAVGLGRRAVAVRADLQDRAGVDTLAREAIAWSSGRIDLLVHNAANFERVEPADLSAEAWDHAMALNATAPYLLTVALAPALRAARGSVVAIACVSAERPWKHYVPYSASKATLVSVVRGLALALAPEVRVNAIAPGAVLLPDTCGEAARASIAAKIPLQRLGAAEDVARAVVFLAENDFISGHVLVVDGGESLT